MCMFSTKDGHFMEYVTGMKSRIRLALTRQDKIMKLATNATRNVPKNYFQ